MILNLVSGRAVRFRQPPPPPVVRWDLMRPAPKPAALPKPAARQVESLIPTIVRNKVGVAVLKVAEITGISAAEIVGPRRLAPIVTARKLAVFLAKQTSARSLPAIGEHMGGRDHSTIFHSFRRVEAAIDKLGLDPEKPPADLVAELWERRKEW